MPIGLPELAVVLVIVLVIFGPKRLPQLGRQLGSGMREFKDSVTAKSGSHDDDEDDDAPVARRPELTATSGDPTPATTVEPTREDAPAPRD